jgi:archaellum biogenesis ATPase FlaH
MPTPTSSIPRFDLTDDEITAIMKTATKIRRRPPRPPEAAHAPTASATLAIPVGPSQSDGAESNPGAAERPFTLVPMGELGPSEAPDWIMPGYIAREAITLLTGLWKAGKSTLLAHLLRDLHAGGGLVETPIEGAVMIVSEEPPSVWARRRDALGIDSERVLIVQRPTFARTNILEWLRLIEALKAEITARGVALVVIDTLPSVWPVSNENDASEALEALTPLRDLSNAGAAVLLVMHPRKGGGGEATATRGSGALPGFVDVIVELRRHSPDDSNDRRRTLRAYGRYDDIAPDTVIELTDEGYTIIGPRAEVRAADEETLILELLPPSGVGLNADEIRALWTVTPAIGRRRLMGLLNFGAAHGKWRRAGMGVKGDPFTYSRPAPGAPAPGGAP